MLFRSVLQVLVELVDLVVNESLQPSLSEVEERAGNPADVDGRDLDLDVVPLELRRPFDQQLYATIQRYQKTGWSNFNGLQFEFEHRYSKGYAFQVFYVMSNAMRVAMRGNSSHTRTPGKFVAIARNGPPVSRPGFGSQVSN